MADGRLENGLEDIGLDAAGPKLDNVPSRGGHARDGCRSGGRSLGASF